MCRISRRWFEDLHGNRTHAWRKGALRRVPALPRSPGTRAVWHIGVPGRKRVLELGLTSTVKPCPEVAGSYQLPERAKSALVGCGVAAEQVTFCVRRVSGMIPVRPVPSVKMYTSCPLVQLSKLNVAVPTACAVVIGVASKLPPVF